MAARTSLGNRLFHTFASVKTGIILLIILGIVAASGTLILQRPMAEPDQMQRAYSPATLQWLDRLGLTDVYHTWWFALLMALVGLAIIFASVERFPKAWRLLRRPYRKAEPHFRAVLPIQKQIPIGNASSGLAAAETAFRHAGLKPQRIVENDEVSLFAEKHRFSVLAVYVVHASLLLILVGGIVDAFWGYKGYISLSPGQSTTKLELRDGSVRPLPFTLRCDATGQENYPDGTPKKWWSRLTVLKNKHELLKKEIVVNDPLVTHGIRFYQSGYGTTGEVESLLLNIAPKTGGDLRQVTIRPEQAAYLDARTSISLAQFIPDFVRRDGQVYTRSVDPVNPAVKLEITLNGDKQTVWLFPSEGRQTGEAPYRLELADVQMAAFTGLQVSHEPGQWAVWAGCILMGLGLGLAFYSVHQRFWAMAVQNRQGELVLWLGTAADKNREHFQETFEELAESVRRELDQAAGNKVAAVAVESLVNA
jgi:cytochrome c biogenesis protein